MNLESRISGALWGALLGDALGVPVEFQGRDARQRDPVVGPRSYGVHHQPAGTWSDDSALLLCTMESLVERGQFDAQDLGRRFVRWMRDGYWSPHGDVFDIGIATSAAITRLAAGYPAEQCGGDGEYDNGNGSLMRILPIALRFHEESAPRLAELAQRASSLTHGHLRSQMACALYVLVVRELIHGFAPAEALRSALAAFHDLYRDASFAGEMRNFHSLDPDRLRGLSEPDINSSGYVMHTLKASLWCLLTTDNFNDAVLKAVNLGYDTDTTGTVTGGLAGAFYGLAAVPQDWKCGLARHDDVAALLDRFLFRGPNGSATSLA